MTTPSPHDLFPQRPVRSDFGRQPPLRRGVNLRRLFFLLVLAGLAVLAGLGVNALMKEEAAPLGEIPTITAEGEIKKRPDDPGGLEVPHQDVRVFEQLEKNAPPADGGVEHLLPPPEQPAPEQAEPMAEPVLPPAMTDPASKTEEILPPAITAATESLIEEVKKTAPEKREEPIKAVVADVPKAKEIAKTLEPKKAELSQEVKDGERLPSELFTNGRTPPAEKKKAEGSAPAAQAAPVAQAAPAAGKGARVQLASFPDEATARVAAQKLQSKYGAVLGGLSLTVVRADLGAKGIYYRVMSAPVAESKAKEICAELKSQSAACLIAR